MRIGLLFLAAALPSMLVAEPRELCPTRPGLNTPPCVVDSGRLLAEVGIADWTRDDSDGVRSDSIDLGQTLVRFALAPTTEMQIGWTAYSSRRMRDATGVTRMTGVGDVTLAVKQALGGGNGPVAIQFAVTAPTGGDVGKGDWEGKVLLPLQFDLAKGVALAATPEIDWRANGSGNGHHYAYGSAAGLNLNLAKTITLSLEASAMRDNDPDDAKTEVLSSASLAWQPNDDTQVDVGVVKGVRAAPDIELYVGISRRF